MSHLFAQGGAGASRATTAAIGPATKGYRLGYTGLPALPAAFSERENPMIDFYALTSPNVQKIFIMLE